MIAPRWRRGALVTVLVVAVAAGTAACGVSEEPSANRIEPDAAPFGLLDDRASTTVAASGRTEVVHFVASDHLVPVERTLPTDAGLSDLIELLVEGPTGTEEELGITTVVPAGTVSAVEEDRGVAVVDLTAEFGDLRAADQPAALAQIVYTLTGQPGIGAVRFLLDGQSVSVPLPDGTTAASLTRDDLETWAPR